MSGVILKGWFRSLGSEISNGVSADFSVCGSFDITQSPLMLSVLVSKCIYMLCSYILGTTRGNRTITYPCQYKHCPGNSLINIKLSPAGTFPGSFFAASANYRVWAVNYFQMLFVFQERNEEHPHCLRQANDSTEHLPFYHMLRGRLKSWRSSVLQATYSPLAEKYVFWANSEWLNGTSIVTGFAALHSEDV